LKGDFEITVGFEVLSEETGFERAERKTGLSLEVIPQPQGEVDLDLWIKPNQNSTRLFRNLGKTTTMFVADVGVWDGNAGRGEVKPLAFLPTNTRAGRLRLARTGAELSYLVSSGSESAFVIFHQEQFGSVDVKQVRVVATTGGPSAAFTARIKDVRIRAQAFTRMPTATLPQKAWWKLLALAVISLLVLTLGVWVYLRQRRKRKKPIPASVEGKHAIPAEAPLAVSFPCPGCGKALKARAELVGKKVKCRHCGKVVPVPQTGPGELSTRSESIKPQGH
jgi:predicted RNA-binding Zn-ribbon protein involved in translation (DUF1610 family)